MHKILIWLTSLLCFPDILSAIEINEIPDIKLWLDAQDIDSLTMNEGVVSQWNNKADPANPVVQNTEGIQPAWMADAINGLPAMNFDGDDYLTLQSSIRESQGQFQIFLIAQSGAGGDNLPRFAASWSGTGTPWIEPNWIFTPPVNGTGVALPFEPNWFFTQGSNHGLQNITIGSDASAPGTNRFKGQMGELILFDRILPVQEFNQVVDYLLEHWNLNNGYVPPAGVRLNPRLRDLGKALGVEIGAITAINFYDFADTEIYQKVLGENFGIITPENDTKYSLLSTGQGTYDFTALDQHIAFAETYDLKLHGHVFIWHSQLPDWLTNGNWTRQELIDILNQHIDTVGGYLKGKVAIWDVVNEPFNDGNGSWRSSIWNDIIDASNSEAHQRDFVDLAFIRAREVDPDAKLILNDYSNEVINPKSDAMYAWAQSMVDRGIPIDGVGFQMHLNNHINYDSFSQNMQRFADLGLEIHITEFDVRITKPFTTEKAQWQAGVYREVLRRVVAQPAVKSFTMWGFTDAYSWIPQFFAGTDNALIFDKDYNPKPAFVAVQNTLLQHMTSERWKKYALGDLADSPEAALEKDLDHDGLSTFFELSMELDPAQVDFENHPNIEITPDRAAVEFTPRVLTPDIEIRIEYSSDMNNWQPISRRAAGTQNWETFKEGIELTVDPASSKVIMIETSHDSPYFMRINAVQVGNK